MVLAGQQPARQRAPDEHAQARIDGERDQFVLGRHLQGVINLLADEPRQAQALRRAQGLHQLPRGVVGRPDVPDLAGGDQQGPAPPGSPRGGLAIPLVHLVQVDVIGAQAPHGQGSRHASSPCYLYSRSPLPPPSFPQCIARSFAVVTASCSRNHVYKNSATSYMIRRTRWLGSRLMAMSERLADASRRQAPPLVRHGHDGFIHRLWANRVRINSRPPARARPD